jgi:hypothetical protein
MFDATAEYSAGSAAQLDEALILGPARAEIQPS